MNNMEEMTNYYDLLIKKGSLLYNEDKNDLLIFLVNYGYNSLMNFFSKKEKKQFYLKSVTEVINNNIPILVFQDNIGVIQIVENNKSKISNDRTGLFKFCFEEKGKKYELLFLCYLNNINEQIQMLYCTEELFIKINKNFNKLEERQIRPKLGIFTGIITDSGTLKYSSFSKEISKKQVYHSIKNEILTDLTYFFDNIKRTILNKEKGTRKILIAGVQGSGKSSFLNEIMLKFKNTHSILICSDLKELIKHIQLCSKYSIPCIPILEDCENYFDDKNSTELNYFSGALEPSNTSGTYIIMTTNHPDRLSDRIKHRPERVDEVYIFSFLNTEDAKETTKFYFGQFLPDNFDYSTLDGLFSSGEFKETTGAEIMKYAQDVKKAANYEFGNFDSINRKYIEKIIKTQKEKYQKLQKIDIKKTQLSKSGNGYGDHVGFLKDF